jgi:hypothetical protein
MVQATRFPIPLRMLARAALVPVLVLSGLWSGTSRVSAAPRAPIKGTLQLSVQPAGQAFLIRVSGTYEGATSIVYILVHSGVVGCARTLDAENTLVNTQIPQLGTSAAALLMARPVGIGGNTAGSYSAQITWGGGAPPGTYWVCAYLAGPGGALGRPDAPPPDATASARLTIGTGPSPTPIKGTLQLSVQPVPGEQTYSITVSGTYEGAPSVVYVYVHSGAQGCAPSFVAENTLVETQMQRLGENAATVLLNQEVDTGGNTAGSYSAHGYWGVDAPPGTYWVCAYLMGPNGEGGQPGVPPDATASTRLTIGAPQPAPATTPGVQITAFYPTTLAAFEANQAGRGGAIPRVSSYAAGTDTVVFYFAYQHAQPGVTRYIINIHLPRRSDVTLTAGIDRLTAASGGELHWVTAPSSICDLPAVGCYLSGLYHADLQVDGRVVAHTSFRIQPGIDAFYTTTEAAFNSDTEVNKSPRVTIFPRGTTGVGLVWDLDGMNVPAGAMRVVFINRSRGTSFSYQERDLTFPALWSLCLRYGGQDCGHRGQPYPSGLYEVDVLMYGHLAVRTSFRVSG